jgi:hypothetical protein
LEWPKAAPEVHTAADDQDQIEAELDKLEAFVRAAHDADLRSATFTLESYRWH